MTESPHRRYNPLLDQWVLVSPQRTLRPWQGEHNPDPADAGPRHDPHCHLCPGNARAGSALNPDYTTTYVFDNDFPALLPGTLETAQAADSGFFRQRPVTGTCRVICYTPAHNLSMANMTTAQILAVIDCWAMQYEELIADYAWVQIFENKGEMMGASSPHPHGQIWASDQLPTEPGVSYRQQQRHYQQNGTRLLLDYAAEELIDRTRVVDHNDHWLSVVPWWATWPFQVMLLPLQPVSHLAALTQTERASLADILAKLLRRYDNLFHCSFPYSMGWQQAPGDRDSAHWQLHAQFFPPLLRSANIRKFMVGYEMLAEAQRDLTPEAAAARLRSVAAES